MAAVNTKISLSDMETALASGFLKIQKDSVTFMKTFERHIHSQWPMSCVSETSKSRASYVKIKIKYQIDSLKESGN